MNTQSNHPKLQPAGSMPDPNAQLTGNVMGGVKDSYFVTKLISWYWKRFKNFLSGK
jgi:hypothetical protein